MDIDTKTNKLLLWCGILSGLAYIAVDLIASFLYPGYSLRGQAVSELFAVGAPTSRWVVPLFSLSSVLLFAFAVGVWRTADARRLVRVLALTFAGSAVVGLLIWNVFPMHMRGAERTFTDTMHLILATNPFVLLSLILAIAAFRGGLRIYSAVTVIIMLVPAIFAFSYAPALELNEPTPWLGATERLAQYGYLAWQMVLAIVLLRRQDRSSADAPSC
ncbi:DUF998 domain-containing protein [Marinobacter sp. DUT-1]|uniref:DUF998 domain-containing protein n=1 Tax=Marinobacter sp. DUT-1 TaxID=3412037 RepID=UPI003D176FB9